MFLCAESHHTPIQHGLAIFATESWTISAADFRRLTRMYSLHFYGQMLADAPRMDAYTAALRRAVQPDSVVLDLGCGPGVFALLACKFGARRVYAIEPDSVIGVAREAAAANRCCIEFFESLSTEITLPEPATVIISDLRG